MEGEEEEEEEDPGQKRREGQNRGHQPYPADQRTLRWSRWWGCDDT